MRRPIIIDGRMLDAASPTFVIAEIGVNHDGSVDRALELVEHARAAGADAIKLQLFSADRLVHASAKAASYQVANCGAADQASLLRKYELSSDAVCRVVKAARDADLVPLATPFSPADVDQIDALSLPAIKIASPDLVNRPLIDRAAATGRPLLLSTGAATLEEIETVASRLREQGVVFALMHCVSAYPTPLDQAQIGWVGDLQRRFGGAVGYSDHTAHPIAGALAVAAGARLIEKHLTWSRTAEGPDHIASFDPPQFAAYVESIRGAEALLGSGSRTVLSIETDVRRLSRQSLILIRPVSAGRPIARADLDVRRPGTGIPANDVDAIVGRTLRATTPAGTLLAWDMLTDAA